MSQLMSDEHAWDAAAHHEAGHCVVALRLSLPVTSVTLGWRKRGFGRRSTNGKVSIPDTVIDPGPLALVVAAGPIAQAVWGQHQFGVAFEDAFRLTARESRDDDEALRNYLRAGRLNRRKVNEAALGVVAADWATVELVAKQLKARQYLTGEQAWQLVFAGSAKR